MTSTTANESMVADNSWKSIYIPNIPSGLHTFSECGTIVEPFTEERLKYMIEEYAYLGKVSRIDFVEKEGGVRSAFVHIEDWNQHQIVDLFRQVLNTEGAAKFCGMEGINGIKSNRVFGIFRNGIRRDFHLIFRINHTPIPAADGTLNIHQLAAANEFLENKVKELENKVKELENRVKDLEDDKKFGLDEWETPHDPDLPETTPTYVSPRDYWDRQPSDRWK
jgi:hypothetical protein